MHVTWIRRFSAGMGRAVAVGAILGSVALALGACSQLQGSETATPTPIEPPATATQTPEPTATATMPPTETPTPRPSPTPTPEPPAAGFLDLEDALEARIAGHADGSEIAVAVTDLQTGDTIDVGGERPHYSGCVMNLFVILEAARMVDSGELQTADVENLIRATTWSSNAATANTLYGIVGQGDSVAGMERVSALLEELGMDGAVLDHPPGYPATTLGIDANNWLTAVETNEALAALYHGELLEPETRDMVLEAMHEVKVGLSYLTASGVPGSAMVHHKNGFFMGDVGYTDNDIGIVRFWRGDEEYAYAVSFFSQRNPEKYSQLPMAQAMMADIWAYFDGAY